MKKIALVAVLAIAAVVAAGAYYVLLRPKLILQRFDDFRERHQPGTSIEDVGMDPFVGKASMMVCRPDLKCPDNASELLGWLRTTPEGSVQIIWVYWPPFGRAVAAVSFADGRVTGIDESYLD